MAKFLRISRDRVINLDHVMYIIPSPNGSQLDQWAVFNAFHQGSGDFDYETVTEEDVHKIMQAAGVRP